MIINRVRTFPVTGLITVAHRQTMEADYGWPGSFIFDPKTLVANFNHSWLSHSSVTVPQTHNIGSAY